MNRTIRILLLHCLVSSCAFQAPPSAFISPCAANSFGRLVMGRHHMLKPKKDQLVDAIEPSEQEENPLILKAKHVIRSNLGVDEPTVLADDNFVWINPYVNEQVGKEDYVAAGRFFNLRSAFPDLDYRSYDFRVDPDDSFTIRCTCRVIGTLQEGLQMRDEVLSPNGRIMVCPPEGISMTFDPVTMKVTKLCTGFCLDRQVGNTGGYTGIQGASVVAGKPMMAPKNVPAETSLSDAQAMRPQRLENPSRGVRSPFPHTVMVQLARGVLASNMGADDPTLLSDDEFFYVTPSVGPVQKKEYLRHYAEQELEGYDLHFSSLRVDPYEPDRVWADARPTAPGFHGPPQVVSCSFDQNGCCIRITTSAVLDPTVGNAGGLGGLEGFKYAMENHNGGIADNPAEPRPLTKTTVSSLTDLDADGMETNVNTPDESLRPMKEVVNGAVKAKEKEPVRPNCPPPIDKMIIVQQEADVSNGEVERAQGITEPFGFITKKVAESFTSPPTGTISLSSNSKVEKTSNKSNAKNASDPSPRKEAREALSDNASVAETKGLSLGTFKDSIRIPDFNLMSPPDKSSDRPKKKEKINKSVVNPPNKKKAEIDKSVVKRLDNLKDMTDSIRIVPEHISRSFSLLIDPKSQEQKAAAENRRQAATDKRAAELKQVVEKKKQTPKPSAQDEKLELARKVQAERRERMNREDLLARARERRDQERRKVPSSLFGTKTDAKPSNTIPKLSRWSRNADGTITGLISGSARYKRNEKVTTSQVKRGKIASKEVVQTGSGSRYYLE